MKVDASVVTQLPTVALSYSEKSPPKQDAAVSAPLSDKVTISTEAAELLRKSVELESDDGVATLMNGGGTEPPPPPPDLDDGKTKD